MINVIVSVIIWGLACFLLSSVLVTGGLPLPERAKKRFSFLDKRNLMIKRAYHTTKKEYGRLFAFSIFVRCVMLLFAIMFLFLFVEQKTISWKTFWEHFVIWDANSYMRIAKGGYAYYLEQGEPVSLVFFPLYSVIIRILHWGLPFISYKVIGLAVSILCYAIGNCFFYAYCAKAYGRKVAKTAVFLLLLSPFSFFFGTLMSESLFFMLIAICLYCIQENKWCFFALAGFLCALCRMQGIIILLPAGIHWFETCRPIEKIRQKEGKELFKDCMTKGIALFTPLLGTLVYFFINYKVTGNAFAFMDYQRTYWQHGYLYIGKAIENHLGNMLDCEMGINIFYIFIPQMTFFVLAIGLCLYACRKFDNKMIGYLLVYTVVSYSLDWLISGSRYMLTALPMWVFLASWMEQHKWTKQIIYIIFLGLMVIYYAAYLFGQPVM